MSRSSLSYARSLDVPRSVTASYTRDTRAITIIAIQKLKRRLAIPEERAIVRSSISTDPVTLSTNRVISPAGVDSDATVRFRLMCSHANKASERAEKNSEPKTVFGDTIFARMLP
jgi:hypothetical protein